MLNKRAYFQGGGGVNEPTPKERKYKADPALVVQPRFKEPFYRNYDLYVVPGMEDVGPGTGWHGLQNYKNVKEFLDARRQRLQPRYVADDSWQLDNGNRVKKNPDVKARASILERLIKMAEDENDGPNFDYGKGLYSNMDKYKSVKDFEEHSDKEPGAFVAEDHALPSKKHDSNNIDFPVDDFIDPNIVEPEPNDVDGGNPVGESNEMGGYLDEYLTKNDFEGKDPSELDFGRDYTEDAGLGITDKDLHRLVEKYLNPSPNHGLYGLPDGVDLPDEDLGDPTNLNPDFGTTDNEITMYEDKWNI